MILIQIQSTVPYLCCAVRDYELLLAATGTEFARRGQNSEITSRRGQNIENQFATELNSFADIVSNRVANMRKGETCMMCERESAGKGMLRLLTYEKDARQKFHRVALPSMQVYAP
jgi:hypothetical protein